MNDPLLQLRNVVVDYASSGGRPVRAVAGVDLDVRRGETLSIVGESGCGKSSLARAIVQSPPPTSGSVRYDGIELTALEGRSLREVRPRLQMIFQDPISSLNPRRSARQIVDEGTAIWGRRMGPHGSVDELLELVGIDPALADRRPHQFSGGQCQRISIARALMLGPELLVCDEPVSALDVSVQAQVLNLLRRLERELGLTLVFIAHDLAVVKNISDRIAVMYLGRVCEVGDAATIFEHPRHPYTAALLSAVPRLEDEDAPAITEVTIGGEVPSPADPPSGCRFRTRCPFATQRCAQEEPTLELQADGGAVACHYPLPTPLAPTSPAPSPSGV